MICRLRNPGQNICLARLDKLIKSDNAYSTPNGESEVCQDAHAEPQKVGLSMHDCVAHRFRDGSTGFPAPSRAKLRHSPTLRKAFTILFVKTQMLALIPKFFRSPYQHLVSTYSRRSDYISIPPSPSPYSLVPPLNSCTPLIPTFLCPSTQHPQSHIPSSTLLKKAHSVWTNIITTYCFTRI